MCITFLANDVLVAQDPLSATGRHVDSKLILIYISIFLS